MAKLSAHGAEVGRIYFTTSAKAYMGDGAILKNSGFGWKLAGKVKAGVTPQQAFENQQRVSAEYIANRPMLALYRKRLFNLCGLSLRWRVNAAISAMPDDFDGVWSECCDGYGDNVSASVDEVAEVCRAYSLAIKEAEELKTVTAVN